MNLGESQKHQSSWTSTLIIAAVVIVTLVVFGCTKNEIDYDNEIVDLLACNYTDDFLKHLGAASQEQCESLNKALYDQAFNECEKDLGSPGSLSEDEYVAFMEQCTYHSLMVKVGVPMSYEATNYARSTGQSPYRGASAAD